MWVQLTNNKEEKRMIEGGTWFPNPKETEKMSTGEKTMVSGICGALFAFAGGAAAPVVVTAAIAGSSLYGAYAGGKWVVKKTAQKLRK